MSVTVTLPLRTLSPNSARRTLRGWMKMKGEQRLVARQLVGAALKWKPQTPPITVELVRVGPRKLDAHDGLPGALKHVVDGISDALGYRDDSHEDLTWKYGQEQGEYAVRVTITPTGATA